MLDRFQLGEHNSWHKYTNFELGTRVPLVVHAPQYPSAMGQVTGGLAELVDLFPTVAELAGVPVATTTTTTTATTATTTKEQVDGVSLVPFFVDPERLSFPTTFEQGTCNKTLAFSQYPHTDGASTPATQCPFYRDGACVASPVTAPLSNEREREAAGAKWMGFSVRDQEWRYTAWMPFNGTRADWGAPGKTTAKRQELYNHSYPLSTTSMDAVDDLKNFAYSLPQMSEKYFALVRTFFQEIQPPTAPAGGNIPPSKACKSWCTKGKFKPEQYCKFVACEACPKC